MSDKITGYLCLWNIPEISVKHTDVEALANDVSFDKDFIPKVPRRRNAWEKATNLGAAGKRLTPPDDKIEEVLQKYGAKPTVRLYTAIVSSGAPRLVRHIVRRVTVPTQQDAGGKRRLAERQLDQETVCIMEFDCKAESFKSTGQMELDDSQHFVNGELRGVVQELHDKVSKAVDYADANDIRRGLRRWLEDKNACLMGSGGGYFVPDNAGVLDDLKSAKAYLEAMHPYRVRPEQQWPQLLVFPLSEDGDTFEVRLDVANNAVDRFKAELQDLTDELAPVVNGARTKTVGSKVRKRCTLRFMEINQQIAQYRSVLDDNLSALDVYLESTSSFIISAQSVEFKSLPSEAN